MRRIAAIAAGLFSIVALSSAASAADLPPKIDYTKAPPLVAPVHNWAGLYIGLNGGGGSSRNCWDLTRSFAGTPPSPLRETCHDASGALVGGQIGYRWQMTNWVFGLEAQGDWANLKGSGTSAIGTFAGLPFLDQTKINAVGLFTGQVGYAWNNVLWYVKGGAALTDDKYNGVSQFSAGGFPAGFAFDQATQTRWGGAIGTGVEFGFAPAVGCCRIRPSFHGQQQQQPHQLHGRFRPHRKHQSRRRHGHGPAELHFRRPRNGEILSSGSTRL